MQYAVIRSSEDPVVGQYLDIIFEAAEATNATVTNVPYKQKPEKKAFIVADTFLVAAYYAVRGYKDIAIWMQGIIPEESYLRNRSKLRYVILSAIERLALLYARAVFVVSEEMKKHYEEKYRIDLSSKTFIMPCFNESGMHSADLSADNAEVQTFVYIGSLSEWQCFKETVRVYALIEKKKGEKVHLTVLTRDKEKARNILELHGVKNYSVDFVNADDVVSRIAGIKYGFVLRKNIAVNRVATPTKLSNYLAAGIIPVYSSCLSDFHQMNQVTDVGVPCDIEDLNTAASSIIANMDQPYDRKAHREKCEQVFATYYNCKRYIKEISEFLRKIK